VRASSEVEPHPRGRPALERGGDSLAWRCAPRAKRRFRPRVVGSTVLVGRWGHQGHGPRRWAVIYLEHVLGLFVFLFFAKVNGFPLVF
jgi:hypothetical protein